MEKARARLVSRVLAARSPDGECRAPRNKFRGTRVVAGRIARPSNGRRECSVLAWRPAHLAMMMLQPWPSFSAAADQVDPHSLLIPRRGGS